MCFRRAADHPIEAQLHALRRRIMVLTAEGIAKDVGEIFQDDAAAIRIGGAGTQIFLKHAKPAGGGFAHAFYLHQRRKIGAEHGGQAAEMIQQTMRQLVHILPGLAVIEQKFQQFMRGNAIQTIPQDALPQAAAMAVMQIRILTGEGGSFAAGIHGK